MSQASRPRTRALFWNFSSVMAAGILSIAGGMLGFGLISQVLLATATTAFIFLVVVDLRSLGRTFKAFLVEFRHPTRAIELFTLVASCGVLGERFASVAAPLPYAFWLGGVAAWILASWQAARSLWRRERAELGGMVTGGWLLAAVGPESLAVVGSSIARPGSVDWLLAISVGFWVFGLGLYAILIAKILGRLIRGGVGLAGFTPDYWIAMGALAIATLAGVRLASSAGLMLSAAARAVLEAIALSTWVMASSWIPYLTLVEVARVIAYPALSRSEPRRWSMVFPLGVYSAATWELGGVLGLPEMGKIAEFFFWAACGGFLFAAVVTARSLLGAKARAVC